MRKFLLPFLLMAMLSVTFAQDTQQSRFEVASLSSAGQEAYQKLFKAEVFRIGGVGYAGDTSDEEIALHTLLKETAAVEALTSLVNSGSPEGSLYGLLGLRQQDRAAYRKAIEQLKAKGEPTERSSLFGVRKVSEVSGKFVIADEGIIPKGEVVTQRGCIITYKQMQRVIAAIGAGSYDEALKRNER